MKKIGIAIVLALLGSFMTMPVYAASVTLDIAAGSIEITETGYTQNGLTTAYAGSYVIRQSNSTAATANTILVTSGNINITINNLNISASNEGSSPISLSSGSSLVMVLTGSSSLKNNFSAGIGVPSGASLTIDGTSAATIESSGIGGSGMITINGGAVSSTEDINGSTITINGGIITANSGIHSNDGNITITGGNVTATGGEHRAGIGGGYGGNGGTITISGGTVTATGNSGGAGIGGGRFGNGGTITITDGTVSATGGCDGAGIGGGGESYGGGGTVTINGGTINVTGGSLGAGIGGGLYGCGGMITINGGVVTATSDPVHAGINYGAGIGGGRFGGGGTVTINGGTVNAIGGYSVAIGGGSEGSACDKLTIAQEAELTVSGYIKFWEKINLTQDLTDTATLAGNSCELTAAASGYNGIYYQWQYSDDSGNNWNNLNGEMGSTLSVVTSPDTDNRLYRCKITNDFYESNDSYNCTFTNAVYAKTLRFTQQPESVETTNGNDTTLTVECSIPSVAYQWQKSTDNGATWTDIAGEIYAIISISAEETALYRCGATVINGDTVYSDSAAVTISGSAGTNSAYYLVTHYLQTKNGEAYSTGKTELLAGTVGSTVTAQASNFEGFTYDPTSSTSSGTVISGSTLTLNLYYTRNSYTITFESGGSLVNPITARYDTEITAPASPTKENYIFEDWYKDEALTVPYTFNRMPAGNITLYAKWLTKENTTRTSQEYLINGISIFDADGAKLNVIPTNGYFAEISVTNITSQFTDYILLAAYDVNGKMLNINYIYADLSIDQTIKFGVWMDNSQGNMAKLKAFVLPQLGGMTPLAAMVELE